MIWHLNGTAFLVKMTVYRLALELFSTSFYILCYDIAAMMFNYAYDIVDELPIIYYSRLANIKGAY